MSWVVRALLYSKPMNRLEHDAAVYEKRRNTVQDNNTSSKQEQARHNENYYSATQSVNTH
jgi:hypothetical protein